MIERELSRSEWVPAAAKRIITHHHAHGGCERCWLGKCDALTWARDRIKALRLAGNAPSRF